MWHWYAQRRAPRRIPHHSGSAELAGGLVRSYGEHRNRHTFPVLSAPFLVVQYFAYFTEIEHEANWTVVRIGRSRNRKSSVLAAPLEQMLACDCEQSCGHPTALNELSRTCVHVLALLKRFERRARVFYNEQREFAARTVQLLQTERLRQ